MEGKSQIIRRFSVCHTANGRQGWRRRKEKRWEGNVRDQQEDDEENWKGEKEGVDVTEKYACGEAISGHYVRPKEEFWQEVEVWSLLVGCREGSRELSLIGSRCRFCVYIAEQEKARPINESLRFKNRPTALYSWPMGRSSHHLDNIQTLSNVLPLLNHTSMILFNKLSLTY